MTERRGGGKGDDQPIDPKVAEARAHSASLEQEARFWRDDGGPAPHWPARVRPAKVRRKRGSRGPKVRPGDDLQEVVQMLAKWRRRGTIDRPMYEAGNRFHNEVAAAHQSNVPAMDLAKVRVDMSAAATRRLQGGTSEESQQAVIEAIEAVGGPGSYNASLLWHCVGLEWTVARWCKASGLVGDVRFASGMLISTLQLLAKHYGN